MRMRFVPIFSAILWVAIATSALSQGYNFFETHDDAARRRQAEQYSEQKARESRGNALMPEPSRGYGEASPSQFSNPRGRSDNYNPNLPRECPPNHMMCR